MEIGNMDLIYSYLLGFGIGLVLLFCLLIVIHIASIAKNAINKIRNV